MAQVFLTNQTKVTYKLLNNMAVQQSPPTTINEFDIDAIAAYMRIQFDPTRYVVRERFKFWSGMNCKPGESILELAARIRQDAVTCDFTAIKDPLDEAMRTRFMCSINNEAVLKALFKVKDLELTFAKAITVAVETEEAAKVAKETVHGSTGRQTEVVNKVQDKSTSFPVLRVQSRMDAARQTSQKACVHAVAVENMQPATVRSRKQFVNIAKRQATSSLCV